MKYQTATKTQLWNLVKNLQKQLADTQDALNTRILDLMKEQEKVEELEETVSIQRTLITDLEEELKEDKRLNKLALDLCQAIAWEKERGLTALECRIYLKSATEPYNSFIAYYEKVYGVEKKQVFVSTFPAIKKPVFEVGDRVFIRDLLIYGRIEKVRQSRATVSSEDGRLWNCHFSHLT